MIRKKNEMRILHVSRSMGQGGAQKVVYQLCMDNKIQEQFVASAGGYYVSCLQETGIKHFQIPYLDKKNPINMLKCIYLIWRIVVSEKIEIIHSHHRMAAFYARIICIFTKTCHVYTAHSIFYDKRKLMQFSLKKTGIVAVGEGVKKNLVEVYGIQPVNIAVVYNSVKAERTGMVNERLKKEKQNGAILIGNIGRLSFEKGIDVFLEAMAIVVPMNPLIKGVIIGDGKERKNLEKTVQNLGIEKNIIFMGYQKNVMDLINQLEFIVLSSRYEGLPLTPIEVFSQRKTIIASNVNGNREVVSDGINGMLFQSENAKELSDCIWKLLKKDGLKKDLEENAYRTYTIKYRYEQFIEGYNFVYRNSTVGR